MYELEFEPSNIWQLEMGYIDKAHMAHDRVNGRLRAGQRLRHWSLNKRIPYIGNEELPDHLAKLLGYKDYGSLMRGHNNRDSEILQALVGPHGFAIYKALEARNHAVAMEASSKEHG